jgi:Arc/MetJ family transcription regulator
LWFRYYAEQISRDESVPIDDALRARVQREHPLPAHFDFRMKEE